MFFKRGRIKDRMLMYLLPVLATVIVVMTVFSYIMTRNILVDTFEAQMESLAKTAKHELGLIDSGYAMLDLHLEPEMALAVTRFKALYEKGVASGTPVNLEKIKDQMGGLYDLIVIDESNTIVNSTMAEALNFNFNTFDPTLGRRITAVRESGEIAHEKIRTNVGTGMLSKFSYLSATGPSGSGAGDSGSGSGSPQVLLEIVYNAPGFEALVAKLDPYSSMRGLINSNPILHDIQIYDTYGYRFSHGGEKNEPTEESLQVVSTAREKGQFQVVSEGFTKRVYFIGDEGNVPNSNVANGNVQVDPYPLSDHSMVLEITYDNSVLLALQHSLAIVVLAAGLAMLAVALVLVYIVVHRITAPIAQLSQGAQAVSRGDYSVTLEIMEEDELGHLTEAFNQMIIKVNQHYADIESKLKTTLLSMGDGVIVTDLRGKVVLMNPVAEQLTGIISARGIARPLLEVFELITREGGYGLQLDEFTYALNREATLSGKQIGVQAGGQSLDARKIPIAYSISPIVDDMGYHSGHVIVFRDITDQKENLDRIAYLSDHDQLTGLYNRRAFDQALEQDCEQARAGDHGFIQGLMLLDVNGLKLVNDAFGHESGDLLLVSVAQALLKVCTKNDIICRIGGDEFVVLMHRANPKVCEAMVDALESTIGGMDLAPILLSVSSGYASREDGRVTISTLFKRSEEMMYRHKRDASQEMHLRMIEVIKDTLFNQAPEIAAHTKRVVGYSHFLSRALGFSEAEGHILEQAALYHDIGKIADLHGNAGDAGDEGRHTEIGYQILKSAHPFSVVSEIVLAHHEKWDGSGFPRGLKGDAIPLMSQVLALTDFYDHLKEKLGLSHEEILNQVIAQENLSFSRDLVEGFRAMGPIK